MGTIVHLYIHGRINGAADNWQLFPQGGIRAGSLRRLAEDAGDLRTLVEDMITSGLKVRQGSNPAANPQNRNEKSPILKPGPAVFDLVLVVDRTVIQWTRK